MPHRGWPASIGLKPILKPTGRESMQPRANKRGGVDLRIDLRQPHATPKFESLLPHPCVCLFDLALDARIVPTLGVAAVAGARCMGCSQICSPTAENPGAAWVTRRT